MSSLLGNLSSSTASPADSNNNDASKIDPEVAASMIEAAGIEVTDDPEIPVDQFDSNDEAAALADVIRGLQSRGLRLPSSDMNVTQFVQRNPIAAFKNREVARFAFAGFEFRDGMLYVYTAAEYARFIEALNELPPIEQASIVEIDLEALARVESPVKRNIARGSLGTTNIVDPRVIK